MPKLFQDKGVPPERQLFTWRDMVRQPISKLDDDGYTRVMIILMNGIEMEAIRFQHSFARMCPDQDDMSQRFEAAQDEESEHLEKVRLWHQEATLREAELAS